MTWQTLGGEKRREVTKGREGKGLSPQTSPTATPIRHILPISCNQMHESFTSVKMSLLTLDPITLYYWDFIMLYHRPDRPISSWASEVCPGAPSCSSTTKTSKSTTYSTATVPLSSTAPSSIVDSVLMKSLSISEPAPAQGLYWKQPNTVNKHILASTLEIIDDKDSDIEIIEKASDEYSGPIELVDENQSTNVEFQCTQDTLIKVKQLKRKLKVCV